MYLFWEKGYDATYISDLIETMGISLLTLILVLVIKMNYLNSF